MKVVRLYGRLPCVPHLLAPFRIAASLYFSCPYGLFTYRVVVKAACWHSELAQAAAQAAAQPGGRSGRRTPGRLGLRLRRSQPATGCKKTTSLLYKMEMDFGDLQIIGLSRIFIQIIGLSLFSPDYRISTREY